jgi:hypothetical protein
MSRISSVLGSAALLLGCAFASAQSSEVASNKIVDAVVTPAVATTYTFTEVNFSGDTFTQLLGINKNGTIAGYHGSGADAQHPNKGFTLTLPNTFTAMNYPSSAQTQVIGINDTNGTAGFYVDTKGVTHGFYQVSGTYRSQDFPSTTFNQFLGWNNNQQAAGYSQDSAGNFHPYVWNKSTPYESILIPGAVSAQATNINNVGSISGFYIDSTGTNHGFLFYNGLFTRLTYPGATFTQALGVNDTNEVVGTYTDTSNLTHGFTWKAGVFQSIDDPNGIGSTVVNGVNNAGTLVGFWGNLGAGISHGFVAVP